MVIETHDKNIQIFKSIILSSVDTQRNIKKKRPDLDSI